MDHHGLLTRLRRVSTALNEQRVSRANDHTWNWAYTTVITPESRCPFCLAVVRSQGIWVLAGPKQNLLKGMLPLIPGGKVTLTYASHPHDTGGGTLCLGANHDGVALLASTPNIQDTPMGAHYIPRWLKRYWGHTCQESRDWLTMGGYHSLLRELDRL